MDSTQLIEEIREIVQDELKAAMEEFFNRIPFQNFTGTGFPPHAAFKTVEETKLFIQQCLEAGPNLNSISIISGRDRRYIKDYIDELVDYGFLPREYHSVWTKADRAHLEPLIRQYICREDGDLADDEKLLDKLAAQYIATRKGGNIRSLEAVKIRILNASR